MLTDKIAIITGGTRGIGRAVAEEFAAQGAKLVLTYHGNDEAAEDTKKEIEKSGTDVIIIKGDVSQDETANDIVAKAKDTYGAIDILVNNAGITRDKLLLRMKSEDVRDVIDTNLIGTFNMIRQVAPVMSKARSGRIINLSSVVGVKGNAGQTNYAASKAGVIGLSLSAAKELGQRGITVNAVAPGFIDTDMTSVMTDEQRESTIGLISLGRTGKPEEVAKLIAFLASDDAAYITGQVIGIDGGLRI